MTTVKKTTVAPTQMTLTQVIAPLKRHKPDLDNLPVKGILINLSGDICRHCDKQCIETGEQGQEIQCDLCGVTGVLVHAACDGISKDHYQGLVSRTSNIENLAYLCRLNSCQVRFKYLKLLKPIVTVTKSILDLKRVRSNLTKLCKKLAQSLKITAKQRINPN